MTDGASPSTIKRELPAVRNALNVLIARCEPAFNPVAQTTKALARDRQIERLLSGAEIERLRVAHEELNTPKTKKPWLFGRYSW